MLTGAGFLIETFAADLVENDQLLTFNQRLNNFAYNLGTFNNGSTDSNGPILVYEQYVLKCNGFAHFCVSQTENAYFLTSLYSKLLALHLYDSEHFIYIKTLKVSPAGGSPIIGSS